MRAPEEHQGRLRTVALLQLLYVRILGQQAFQFLHEHIDILELTVYGRKPNVSHLVDRI